MQGSYHGMMIEEQRVMNADCETISAKDTATMKKIFGGTWSWERREVIVSVGGLKLAGSMSGMPHAGLDKYTRASPSFNALSTFLISQPNCELETAVVFPLPKSLSTRDKVVLPAIPSAS
jgi:hypothetical protein